MHGMHMHADMHMSTHARVNVSSVLYKGETRKAGITYLLSPLYAPGEASVGCLVSGY